jgi:hypothetical protein
MQIHRKVDDYTKPHELYREMKFIAVSRLLKFLALQGIRDQDYK